MGRPRGFDEDEAVAAAVGLFATHGFAGTSIDDLVAALGVHRASLYRVFGSKRGLYLIALRRQIDHRMAPIAEALGAVTGSAGTLVTAALAAEVTEAVGLVLAAAVETAPTDPEVTAEVARAFELVQVAVGRSLRSWNPAVPPGVVAGLTDAAIGAWLRLRAGGDPAAAAYGLLAFAQTIDDGGTGKDQPGTGKDQPGTGKDQHRTGRGS
jgi:TetR/AcrR family transcriptional repressor of nem operon